LDDGVRVYRLLDGKGQTVTVVANLGYGETRVSIPGMDVVRVPGMDVVVC
jgi:hypothetical protein